MGHSKQKITASIDEAIPFHRRREARRNFVVASSSVPSLAPT